MTIKSSIKPILPPTERAFTSRVNDLERRIIELERINQIQCEQISELKLIQERCLETSRYTNLEYIGALSTYVTSASKKILIAGWYGASNFGDDLMLKTLLERFSKSMLHNITVLLWDDPFFDRLELPLAVNTIHYPKTTQQIEQLANVFDMIVWGGGAILDDRQFDNNPNNYSTGNLFIRLNLSAIAKGKQVWCLGLSANDRYQNAGYLSLLQKIINGSMHFSLRDRFSLQQLESNGIDCSNITLCNDIAFASKELSSLAKTTRITSSDSIGLVCLCIEELYEHYIAVLHALATDPALRNVAEIRLISFYNEGNHDEVFLSRLSTSIQDSRVRVVPYATSIPNLELSDCSLCICYKYHAALISCALGIPTLIICNEEHPHYSNKMRQLGELFPDNSILADVKELEKNPTKPIGRAMAISSSYADTKLINETTAWLNEISRSIEEQLVAN